MRRQAFSSAATAVASIRCFSVRSAPLMSVVAPVNRCCGGNAAAASLCTGSAVLAAQRGLHVTSALRAPTDVPEDLAKDLHGIIHNDRLVMFLTGTPEEPRCRFTMQVVDLMDQLGVRYGFFNIMEDDEVCEGLKRYSDWPTYPQVYIDGELLGGYDICKQMMLDGSLTKLLKEKELL